MSVSVQWIDGGVTAPKGYKAGAASVGIKTEGRPDMAMLVSEAACAVAGTFTRNLVKAAPVVWDSRIVHESGAAKACVMNSGVANACTGEEGAALCRSCAQAAGEALRIDPDSVLLASTGVIGRQLPMDKMRRGIGEMAGSLSDSREAAAHAAEAIMTTDTVKKEFALTFELGGKTVTLGGMSKGSGMIHPNMGTMLAFLTTDAAVEKDVLQAALTKCVGESFNMISVDGDTSTNDTCLLFANGLAGNAKLCEAAGADFETFTEALMLLTKALARRMAWDGEGAHALLEATVEGASSKEQAVTIAKSVITSSLVKTAVAGHDANWGRILCAMGYSGAVFEPEKVDLTLASRAGSLLIVSGGVATDYSEETATKILSEDEITVRIDLKEGSETATAWGCDLTHEYISINADYRS